MKNSGPTRKRLTELTPGDRITRFEYEASPRISPDTIKDYTRCTCILLSIAPYSHGAASILYMLHITGKMYTVSAFDNDTFIVDNP